MPYELDDEEIAPLLNDGDFDLPPGTLITDVDCGHCAEPSSQIGFSHPPKPTRKRVTKPRKRVAKHK